MRFYMNQNVRFSSYLVFQRWKRRIKTDSTKKCRRNGTDNERWLKIEVKYRGELFFEKITTLLPSQQGNLGLPNVYETAFLFFFQFLHILW